MQAGELLTFSLDVNTVQKTKYFVLQKKEIPEKHSLSRTLESSVKEHLLSDVPIGIQLSGGIDSSLVALFASKHSKVRLHTFAIGMEEKEWNEFVYSDRVANQLGTDHHRIFFTKQDFSHLFSELTYHLDEPVVHPNTIPMYILAKEARKFTKVLLTGEGADEVFMGYSRYNRGHDPEIVYLNAFSNPKEILGLLKNEQQVDDTERRKILNRTRDMNDDDRKSFYDIYTYLPHVLLRQDKAGMAANLENRVPFLYDSVVQYGFGSDGKIGVLGNKTLLKKISLKYFPEDLVLRKKCGFGLPIADWLRDKDALLPELQKVKSHEFIGQYFKMAEIGELIEEHLSKKRDNSVILYTIIALVVWHDIFIAA